jgi:hypothetical protein
MQGGTASTKAFSSTPMAGTVDDTAWAAHAACRESGAPSMFVDDWGIGRYGRRRRAAALACCQRCPVRAECGRQALAEVDAGLCLYGVRSGIEFTEVTPSRRRCDVERLRAVVAGVQPSNGGRRRPIDCGGRGAAPPRTTLDV